MHRMMLMQRIGRTQIVIPSASEGPGLVASCPRGSEALEQLIADKRGQKRGRGAEGVNED